ncbi:hypothetical protein SDJN03_25261, partial [Cucurbita argyrosperma subsp. sororia]
MFKMRDFRPFSKDLRVDLRDDSKEGGSKSKVGRRKPTSSVNKTSSIHSPTLSVLPWDFRGFVRRSNLYNIPSDAKNRDILTSSMSFQGSV